MQIVHGKAYKQMEQHVLGLEVRSTIMRITLSKGVHVVVRVMGSHRRVLGRGETCD